MRRISPCCHGTATLASSKIFPHSSMMSAGKGELSPKVTALTGSFRVSFHPV
uniref:Uncharacterized protein n=1 Tax=Arundo donax TaxID=35708 RepID=A0A0A9HK52_ARUDO